MQDERDQPQVRIASELLDKQWFAHVGGQTYGPYSGHEIKRLALNNQILGSDLLWPEGGSAWTRAENEPSLGGLFRDRLQTSDLSSIPDVNEQNTVQVADNTPAPKKRWYSRWHYYRSVFQRADQDQVRDDLRTFFGPRADKYLAIYERMRARNKPYVPFTWNWIVLLTGFPWYFYRKMYVTGALLIFLPPLFSYLLGITGNVGIGAAMSVSAKSQYVLSGIRRIQKADTLNLTGNERREYLQRAGGVSIIAGVLASLLCAAIFAVIILAVYVKHHKSAH